MNKDKFKNLDVLDQIMYVNNRLKEGQSLTSFSEEINISRKTISRNFSKAGYKFSQSQKQYIVDNTNIQAKEMEKYDKNINKRNTKSTISKNNNIKEINTITTNLEISNNQRNNLIYLIDNVDRIREILDGKNKDYKNIVNGNICKKEDLINEVYSFKQSKKDYRTKTLKLDLQVQKGFEKIANDLKDSGITQQELLNYILNQYIKFYEKLK